MEHPETEDRYMTGGYMQQHPDWHLADAPNKAMDLLPGLLAAIDDRPDPALPFRVTDVGGGVGGVMDAIIRLLKVHRPTLPVVPLVMEISPQAVEKGRILFRELPFVQEPLSSSHGPFDTIILADVLEHLENPRQMLRDVAASATHVVVRQPLLENFGLFRRNGYRNQRETWGHIGFFNYRNFIDMMDETGWEPLKVDLVPPWKLSGGAGGSLAARAITGANRVLSSYIVCGFYLNGCFKRIVP